MVIHDGVDPERYLEVHPGGRSSRLTIGVIGRISPWKGQDIFLKAAARLRRDFNEVVFRVIGDPLFGEEAYQRQLLALCTELDLGDRVQFTGFVSNIPEQLADLDIVVHSSVIGEPFGQVIIEAMAAGKPLIATDGGGVPEIVVDGATGLLVPMGDVEAMAAAMDRLVSNPKIRERMGRSGRDRARRVFHIDQTVKKLHRVYEMMRPAPTPPRELDSASKSKRGDSSPVKLDAVLSDLNVVARHQDLATGSTPKLSTGIARLLQAITRGWERRVLDPTG
jgi:glycosyltransferase involved in cell wall biosynthesis